MHFSTLLPLTLALTANAAYQGFNYGSTFTDSSAKQYQNFVDEFNAAKKLVGTNGGFTSARLYTMVQAGTTADPISALKAAADTDTSLLLGVWASGGDAAFANELTALKSAISTYPDLAGQIAGLSVGSEDLYRISPIGVENESGVGVGPDVVTNYISQVKDILKSSTWSAVPVGHVDTWTAWVNGSNSAVVTASDFLGVDAYPYSQSTETNGIDNAKSLFEEAVSNTEGASAGKPVWITETGWPVSGPVSNLANADTDDAKTYWDEVGCPRFGSANIWWYTLQDAAPTTPSPSFGVLASLTGSPLYDLSCSDVSNSTSSASSSTSATGSNTAIPTSGGALVPSGAGAAPQYSNATIVSTVNGQPTTITTATAGSAATGGSDATAASGATATSGSDSGSDSGSSTSASTSSSVTPYTGSASVPVKGSVVGILGALAAAVMLL